MDEMAGETMALPPIAGLWRRFFSFCLDGVLLGAFGACVGFAAYDRLVALGDWGRALGFAIALVYFGLTDSRLCNGQSFGKWLLGIKVVAADGAPLSVGSAALRATIFCVPYFLNGTWVERGAMGSWIGGVLTFLVFGIGVSVTYLLIFNRHSRQSLHDLAVGAFVVISKAAGAPKYPEAIWRPHFATVGLILMGALALPYLGRRLAASETFAALLSVQQALEQEPDVRHATVGTSVNFFSSSQRGSTTRHAFNSRIVVLRRITEFDPVANRSVQVILDRDPAADQVDIINVAVMYGYDIGIASAWRTQNFSYSPEVWRRRIASR